MSEHTQCLEICRVVYTDNFFYEIAIRRDSSPKKREDIIDNQ